jgi:hypothetical protein
MQGPVAEGMVGWRNSEGRKGMEGCEEKRLRGRMVEKEEGRKGGEGKEEVRVGGQTPEEEVVEEEGV